MIAVETCKAGKAYQIYAKPIDSLKELFFRRVYHDKFWALQDISIRITAGSALGIIGGNGSGKTTLLQLLAGILTPTSGTVLRNGRVSAILELGSGFHPDLSGRENIKLGCARLGIPQAEIPARIAEIIEFSELQDFINRPVKTYSTGMYARLAFSLAVSVTPDILVVDEVLSVGDQHFQKKSLDRMMALRHQGITMIFCSHSMFHISKICDQVVWLKNGRIQEIGPAMEVTQAYENYMRLLDAPERPGETSDSAVGVVSSSKVLKQQGKQENYLLETSIYGNIHDGVIVSGGKLSIAVKAHIAPETFTAAVNVGVMIFRNDGVCCYGVSTVNKGIKFQPLGDRQYGILFILEDLALLAGQYIVEVLLLDEAGMHVYDRSEEISFNVTHDSTRESGMVRLQHRWEPLTLNGPDNH